MKNSAKRSILTLLLPSLMLSMLSGCNGDPSTQENTTPGDTTVNPSDSGVDSTPSTTSDESVVSNIHVDDYEDWINSWSKSGHLYIHYLRPEATESDYDKYALWIWQHKPKDLEGSLWGYSGKTQVSSTLTLHPMSNHWMTPEEVGKKDESNAKAWTDDFGRIIDVDLYNENLVGGKSNKPISFEGATNVGFLVVRQDSMDGSSNWVSDGGTETYITDFDQHFRTNGSMHVFVVSGNLRNYEFESGQQEIKINPVTTDETGMYTSSTETITDTFPTSPTSKAFKSIGVGYQVFVPSFRDSDGDGLGDLRGVIDSLDYLEGLGVQALWLTPIQQSDSYHGYDISDYYAVDSKFGTIDDYRELLYKAHKKGMKVLMDLVLNHTSKNNVWFTKSQWAINSPNAEKDDTGIKWRDVYSWKYGTDKILKYSGGSYKTITVEEDSKSDNPSWYRDGESNYYYYGKFGSGMPEINYENQATRNLVKDMAKYWLSFGLDGFRLDAVKHIYMKDEVKDTGDDIIITDVGEKTSYDDEKGKEVTKAFDYSSDLTKNLTWWKEFSNDLKAVYPDCFLVGENFDGWGTRIAPYYQAMDSQFNFSLYYHIAQKLYSDPDHYGSGGASAIVSETRENDDDFRASKDTWKQLSGTGVSVPGGDRQDFINGSFTSNHDVMRAINKVNGTWYMNGALADSAPKEKVTGTAQEIGRAKIHGAITMLVPGLSWIYYGDELGMSSNTDQHIAKYGNENSEDIWYRQPFLWKDTTKRPNFTAGQYKFELDSYNQTVASVEDQVADPSSMYNWYKAVNEVKRMYPTGAKYTFNSSSSNDVLIMDIQDQNGSDKFRIFINIGKEGANYGVQGMSNGYSFVKAIGGASKDDISKAYSILVYQK